MAKVGRPRKRRVRSPHPGVKLIRRNRTTGDVWLARWVDPDSGKAHESSVTALGLTTDESRRAWAIAKSRTLLERKAALESGAAIITRTPVAVAVARFEAAQATELKPSTLRVYREATAPFQVWAGDNAPIIEGITGPKLTAFRSWFVALPAFGYAKGKGAKGKRMESPRKRSAGQQNKIIRALRTVLNFWRMSGLTPQSAKRYHPRPLEVCESAKARPRVPARRRRAPVA